ncbi:MAG TPA: FG-GAP-like repeat-containing protein [Pyrinomonadaceae bacterium]|jgi:uncharacterized delta-60 repeat protein
MLKNFLIAGFALSMIFSSILIFSPSSSVAAANPILDAAFGTNAGKNTTSFGGLSEDEAADIAIQPDGKIVVVGTTRDNGGSGGNTVIVRYRADGTLDTGFNGTGTVVASYSTGLDAATAVAIQPDGKIIIGGVASFSFATAEDFMLLRYNPNGTLDTSFGTDGSGVVVTDFGNNLNDRIDDIVLQPDGKIIAVGYSKITWTEMAFARYNPDGTLDTGFGTAGTGKIVTQFGVGDDFATEVALQPDGKIVIVGSQSTAGNNIALLRFNPNGTPDTTFDGDGILIYSSLRPDVSRISLIIQPDGKYIAGFTYNNQNNNRDFALVRFNPDGTLDSTFGTNGVVIAPVGISNDVLGDIVLLPDGKIIAGGSYVFPPANKSFSLVKFNANGSLDAGFGTGGKVFTTVTTGADEAIFKMALQPDGKLAVTGVSVGNTSNTDFTIARYQPNGALDLKFGEVGLVYTTVQLSSDEVQDIVQQPDGKIIAAGVSRNQNLAFDCALMRYNPNGTLDPTFNGQGRVVTSLNNLDDGIFGVAVQPDGKIVATGYSGRFPEADLAVLRYNANGSLDTTFSGDGVIILPLSTSADVGYEVMIQPDGKIVVAGYSFISLTSHFTVLRFNPDGSPDTSFDADGIATANINGWGALARAAVLQPDGKILVAGDYLGPDPRDFAVMRFNADGSLDSGFGTGGKVTTPIGTSHDEANAITLQPSGKIVVAGFSASSTVEDFAVVRYNPDGSLDTSFDGDGKILTPIDGNSSDVAYSVVSQPDGKIIVAGASYIPPNSNSNFTMVRYNPNGSLDSSFAPGGKLVTDYGHLGELARSMILQRDGKILLGGGINKNALRQFALVRYSNPSTVPFDYDGDGKADLSVFRPSNGSWYISHSSNNAFISVQFGANGDLIAPADYDGDGKTDICVFRPSDGGWYRLNSSNNTFSPAQFGTNGDLPVPGDFDGDGKADLTVYRPSAGSWYRINSSNNQFIAAQFGVAEDKPLVGDFDGDGKSDLTVFRPSNGTWYRINSATDSFSPAQFGAPGDLPVAADYDGDGKTDLAVYRPSVGDWYIINSSNASFTGIHFGITEDKPAPADFDGDGKADLVVFRPSTGTWYLLRTTAGFTGFQFGANGDVPAPNAFVR